VQVPPPPSPQARTHAAVSFFRHRTVLTSPTRVTPPSCSRAPRRRPARSRSTRARTPAAHTSPAPRPPRRPSHRAHARGATPRPEPCSHRAPPPARALPRRAGAVPGNLRGGNPGLRRFRARRTRHDQIWALGLDWRRRRRPSPRRRPRRRRRSLSRRAAAHPWPRSLTSKGKTKPCYTSSLFRSYVGPAERASPPASRCRAAAVSGISANTLPTRGDNP
jgi:hypothetical protein